MIVNAIIFNTQLKPGEICRQYPFLRCSKVYYNSHKFFFFFRRKTPIAYEMECVENG